VIAELFLKASSVTPRRKYFTHNYGPSCERMPTQMKWRH